MYRSRKSLKHKSIIKACACFNDYNFREDSHSTRKRTNDGKQLWHRSLKNDVVPSKWLNVP